MVWILPEATHTWATDKYPVTLHTPVLRGKTKRPWTKKESTADLHLQTFVRVVVHPIHVQPLLKLLRERQTRKTSKSRVFGPSDLISSGQSIVCTQFAKSQFLKTLQASAPECRWKSAHYSDLSMVRTTASKWHTVLRPLTVAKELYWQRKDQLIKIKLSNHTGSTRFGMDYM